MSAPERSERQGLVARLRRLWPAPTELVLFCLVGGSGVVVDFAVLYPLVAFLHTDARLAAVPAFAVAVSWNYLLNRRITFAASAVSILFIPHHPSSYQSQT